MRIGVVWKIALVSAVLLVPVLDAFGLESHARQFRDAYFLETHERDLGAAADLYAEVANARKAPSELRAEARARLARCREAIRAQNPATLMPPDTILYAEIRQPGRHVENLATMLGLMGDPLASLGEPGYAVPGEQAFLIPRRVMLSPALFESLKAFEGLAVAITGLDLEREAPMGVMVLNPGEARVVRGLIETVAQFVQPAAPIGGHPALRIDAPDFSATVALTARLVVIGTNRDLVEGVIARLDDDGAESLAGTDTFKQGAASHDEALAYVFANVQAGLKYAYRMAGQDRDMMRGLMTAQAVFDLAHLNSLALALGSSNDALQAEFVMSLAEGQTNMVYNLLRTPPMHGRALRLVPGSAAAVLAVGLNPDLSDEGRHDVTTKSQTVQAVTGLDLGREMFGNVREFAVFATAPSTESGPGGHFDWPVPDVGLAFAVGNGAKSEALWNYLLSLPARVTGSPNLEPQTREIRGIRVRAYALPNEIIVHLARTENSIIVGSTPAIIDQTLAAIQTGRSVLDEPALASATSLLADDTSVMFFGHVGRIASIAGRAAPPEEATHFHLLSEAARQTMFTFTVDESPTRLRMAGRFSGLPQVDTVVELLARVGVLSASDAPLAHEDTADATSGALGHASAP